MSPQLHILIRKQLQLKSYDYFVASTLLTQLILVGLCFFLSRQESVWAQLLAAIPLSVLMIRSFAIMHEASHKAFLRNHFLNDLIGEIHGAICQLPLIPWKRSHLLHHQYSGNIEKDPVMAFLKVYPKLSQPQQKILTVLWNAWVPILAFVQQVVLWNLSIRTCLQEKKIRPLISLALPLLFWGGLFFLAAKSNILFSFLPALFLYYISIEVVNFPHHLQIQTLTGTTQLPAREQFLTARTCIYPNIISKVIALHFNYHIEHHMYPDITWRELPKIHQALQQHKLEIRHDKMFAWIQENRKQDLQIVFFGDQHKTMKQAS